ncbi:PREDICTED: alpha-(1,6)-fucosyltransferase-like, partial [Nanorana parkeri]|uniref:alpha-(1,6)-fucosyltransferase-like n=1 Tax=Nanorana parkeri TaxID=125878 RepID=UPI000854025E
MRSWTGSWRWIMLILCAWGTLLFYIGGHLVRDNDSPDHSSRELSKILAKLERLKQQNEDLRRMAESLRIPEGPVEQGAAAGRIRALEEQLLKAKEQIEMYKQQSSSSVASIGKDHEILRRAIENGAKEFWYFVQSELKKLKHVDRNELQRRVDELLADMGIQQRSVMTDLYYLSQTDGAGDWREREAKDLTELVQRRIAYIQNPKDCSKAKKLVCNINKGCGYGCQLHHVVYCFMIAFGTQRTLILESQSWRYATGGWETVFKPVSNTCTDRAGTSTGHWSGTHGTRKHTLRLNSFNSRLCRSPPPNSAQLSHLNRRFPAAVIPFLLSLIKSLQKNIVHILNDTVWFRKRLQNVEVL